MALSAVVCWLMLGLISPAVCAAQEPAATSNGIPAHILKFTPTGDALWDSYAEALLEHLPQIELREPDEEGSLCDYYFQLPDELLASWEPRFGDDPRYWQLCWWNSIAEPERPDFSMGYDEETVQRLLARRNHGAVVYLERALERGIHDPVIARLYGDHQWLQLRDEWWRYQDAGSGADRPAAFPADITTEAFPRWLLERRAGIYRQLHKDFPDESSIAYDLAITLMELGEWDEGLAAMQAGNAAPSNRVLWPFPASLLIASMSGREPFNTAPLLGSDLAAGMAIGRLFSLTSELSDSITTKNMAKAQLARCEESNNYGELEIWRSCVLRQGSMQDSFPIQWLVMLVVQGILAHHVLVDAPEKLSSEQREMWLTDKLSLTRVGNIVWAKNEQDGELYTGSWIELYGHDPEEEIVHDSRWRFVRPYRKFHEQGLAGAALDYLYVLEYFSLDYGEAAENARHRFERRLNPPEPAANFSSPEKE